MRLYVFLLIFGFFLGGCKYKSFGVVVYPPLVTVEGAYNLGANESTLGPLVEGELRRLSTGSLVVIQCDFVGHVERFGLSTFVSDYSCITIPLNFSNFRLLLEGRSYIDLLISWESKIFRKIIEYHDVYINSNLGHIGCAYPVIFDVGSWSLID